MIPVNAPIVTVVRPSVGSGLYQNVHDIVVVFVCLLVCCNLAACTFTTPLAAAYMASPNRPINFRSPNPSPIGFHILDVAKSRSVSATLTPTLQWASHLINTGVA